MVLSAAGAATPGCSLGTARPLTLEALFPEARLLLPSLNSCLCTEKVEPLGSDNTRSNRPVGILESDDEGRVRARSVGGGGTNP